MHCIDYDYPLTLVLLATILKMSPGLYHSFSSPSPLKTKTYITTALRPALCQLLSGPLNVPTFEKRGIASPWLIPVGQQSLLSALAQTLKSLSTLPALDNHFLHHETLPGTATGSHCYCIIFTGPVCA